MLLGACFGIFKLLHLLNTLLSKEVSEIYAYLTVIFYLFNYFTIFSFGFQTIFYLYTMMPLIVYFYIKSILNYRNFRVFVINIIALSFVIEISSFAFSLVPLLIYFLFILFAITITFRKQIISQLCKDNGLKNNYLYKLKRTSFAIAVIVSMNSFWIASLPYKYNLAYYSVSNNSGGLLNSINIYFTHGSFYPLKWLSLISVYPQLFGMLNNNSWVWIIYFQPVNHFFFALGILFFVILLIPLFSLKSKDNIYNPSTKIKLYFFTFLLVFIGLQGINPIDTYIYYFLQHHFIFITPELFATYYEFIELPILFFYMLLIYDALYEISRNQWHFISQKASNHKRRRKLSLTRYRKIIVAIIVFLILFIYPFYIYTPEATQVYDTGHGIIHSEVIFPQYFVNLTNYIQKNSNYSDTLILPLSSDFLTMDFGPANTFADDSYPGLLFGSPVITGQNSTIFNWINNAIVDNDSNFSTLLNDLNVKFIILNVIFDKYAIGYSYNPNIQAIVNFLNKQSNISFLSNFGPLLLYKNNNYDGIIQNAPPYFTLGSMFVGKENVISDFENMQTSVDKNITPYPIVHYNLTGEAISVLFPENTSDYYLHSGVTIEDSGTMNVNLEEYNYLIIDFNGSQLYNQSGPKVAVYTYSQFQNGTYLSSFLFPEDHVHELINASKNTTELIYFLHGSKFYENNLMLNLSAGSGFKLQKILLWIQWYNPNGKVISKFPSYVNISRIYFAKSISDGASFEPFNNSIIIHGLNYKNETFSSPHISYRRLSCLDYLVHVTNATFPFIILLKQSFNRNWYISGMNKLMYYHLAGDYIMNAWIVNQTGNFTFRIIFGSQNSLELENYYSLSSNIAALLVIIFSYPLFFEIRRFKKLFGQIWKKFNH